MATTGTADGVPAMGDHVTAGKADATVMGWVRFTACVEYSCREEFEADERRHCVGRDSPYAWSPGRQSRQQHSYCVSIDYDNAWMPLTRLPGAAGALPLCRDGDVARLGLRRGGGPAAVARA